MVQILKRDFLLHSLYLGSLIFIIPVMYLMGLNSGLSSKFTIYLYYGAMTGLMFNAFYYDDKNKANRSVISLPIPKKSIVQGRYAFFSAIFILFICYQWMIDLIVHMNAPFLGDRYFMFENIINIITFMIIIAAISIPIYYFFESVIPAIIVQTITLCICILSFGFIFKSSPEETLSKLSNIFVIQPIYLILFILLVIFYSSYRLSVYIFTRKDCV